VLQSKELASTDATLTARIREIATTVDWRFPERRALNFQNDSEQVFGLRRTIRATDTRKPQRQKPPK